MRNSIFKKGLVIGIIILFLGMSIISSTASFVLKENFNPIENNATYKISQFIQRDIECSEHLIYDSNLDYDSRFLSKEKTMQYLKNPLGYEEVDSFYQDIISTDMFNNADYTPHEPIEIRGDEDFTFENGVTSGNGTKNDPFIIEGWEINSSWVAIYIEYTTAYFLIKNCLIKGTPYDDGINLINIAVGSISDCIILSGYAGINLYKSTNVTLRNNTIYDNKYNMEIYGLEINQYHHDIDTSNTVNGKPIYYLVNEHDIVIDENYDIGFLGLISCKDILVTDVTISDSFHAVLLVDSSNITISTSDFLDSNYGLYLRKSPNNNIIGCNIVNAGISFFKSPNNVMRETSIDGYQGFGVSGDSLNDYYQDIDTSNMVNGKPIYYLVEEQDVVFTESNVGFLALINCNNMVVEKVKISDNMDGMLIAETKGTIKDCETSNNFDGLSIFGDCDLEINNFKTSDNVVGCYTYYSSNIDILNCDFGGFIGCIQIDYSHDITIKDCIFWDSYDDGITLINSYNNEISDNKFSLVEGPGILLDGGWGNTISYNNVYRSNIGIWLMESHNNTICHNKIHDLTMTGLWLSKSVDNNIFRNNIYDISGYDWTSGIEVYESERCEINYNNIYKNVRGLYAVRCDVNATSNWWGSKKGPSGIGPGDGDSIEVIGATVSYEPWLKRPVFRSRQVNYGYSGLFKRFFEYFSLMERLLSLLLQHLNTIYWM